MKEPKYIRRDRKYRKKKFGMKIDGKSVFTIRDEIVRRNRKRMKRRKLR
ncbi:hypothetical protein LCGC14_1094140 [marine sediment metagenome]|uniref:Uncharacterized protein n=1 Tax=marine sediment metagenome TaxID=412755 RepID=A0A0F9QHG4_9ZZZZ